MKILIFVQPFPGGNYFLHQRLSKIIRERFPTYEVYIVEQLHGRAIEQSQEYIDSIKALSPDIMYFEMLDIETFKLVEQFKNTKKILCYCSKGILSTFDEIFEYYGRYYDYLLTNSTLIRDTASSKGISCEFFPLYYSALTDDDLIYDEKYNYDSIFLGMGNHRRFDEKYRLERELFFNNFGVHMDFDTKLFGVGWDGYNNNGGILPPNDIGKLYTSAKSSFAMVETYQRSVGMINNRYVELGFSKCPIITYPYPLDWYGLDKYVYFVEDRNSVYSTIYSIVNNVNPDNLDQRLTNIRYLIEEKHEFFLHMLYSVIHR